MPACWCADKGAWSAPGGEYANRLYITGWYIIGPFPGGNAAGLRDNPIYPPEKAVLLDAVYFGKDERLLKWRYVSSQSYPLVPPDSCRGLGLLRLHRGVRG